MVIPRTHRIPDALDDLAARIGMCGLVGMLTEHGPDFVTFEILIANIAVRAPVNPVSDGPSDLLDGGSGAGTRRSQGCARSRGG